MEQLTAEHDAYERNRTDEGDMLHDVGCYCECPECIGSESINSEPCTCGKCHHCIPEDEYNT